MPPQVRKLVVGVLLDSRMLTCVLTVGAHKPFKELGAIPKVLDSPKIRRGSRKKRTFPEHSEHEEVHLSHLDDM